MLLRNIIITLFLWICGGLIPPASAYDAGDGFALVLGMILLICGFMACLGAYAKKTSRT